MYKVAAFILFSALLGLAFMLLVKPQPKEAQFFPHGEEAAIAADLDFSASL